MCLGHNAINESEMEFLLAMDQISSPSQCQHRYVGQGGGGGEVCQAIIFQNVPKILKKHHCDCDTSFLCSFSPPY